MKTKIEITRDWLPRYTGTEIAEFGDYILLTNFSNYITKFAERFDCEIRGEGGPMQTATNKNGLSIINFGIGSANAATIMDLLTACNPKGVLFLGKCGGLKQTAELGRYIIPIAAIRGEGTSNDYLPPEVPAFGSTAHSRCFRIYNTSLSHKIPPFKVKSATDVTGLTCCYFFSLDKSN